MAMYEGERTSQLVNSSAISGAKFFGTSLAQQTIANPNSPAKYASTINFLIIGAAVAAGLFIYFRKGR